MTPSAEWLYNWMIAFGAGIMLSKLSDSRYGEPKYLKIVVMYHHWGKRCLNKFWMM